MFHNFFLFWSLVSGFLFFFDGSPDYAFMSILSVLMAIFYQQRHTHTYYRNHIEFGNVVQRIEANEAVDLAAVQRSSNHVS